MSFPPRPRVQPPAAGSFNSSAYPEISPSHSTYVTNLPTSSPVPQHGVVATQEPASKGPNPAKYTLDDEPRGEPGTAAFYKSWAFRQKVNEGTTMVPEQKKGGVSEGFYDSTDENFIEKTKHTEKKGSLVMVFSKTSVRRASTQRKADGRMQRSNRRR